MVRYSSHVTAIWVTRKEQKFLVFSKGKLGHVRMRLIFPMLDLCGPLSYTASTPFLVIIFSINYPQAGFKAGTFGVPLLEFDVAP